MSVQFYKKLSFPHRQISEMQEITPNQMSVEELFQQAKAVKYGHFIIKSGHHTSIYFEKALLFQKPHFVDEIAKRMATMIESLEPDILLGPPIGGTILSFAVASKIGCRFLFLDKEGAGEYQISRGYSINRHERILIVDDITSTGETISKIENYLDSLNLNCVGSAVVMDRRSGTVENVTVDCKYPMLSLLRKADPPNYLPDQCPICQQGDSPIVSKLERLVITN